MAFAVVHVPAPVIPLLRWALLFSKIGPVKPVAGVWSLDTVQHKHIIKFNIKGKNVRPSSIGMGELGDLLKHLEAAVSATIPPEDRVAHSEDSDPLVSLVFIQEGQSSDMGMAVLDYALPGVRDITESIASKDYLKIPIKSHEHISYISKWAVKKRVAVEFEENKVLSIPHVIISRKSPVPSPLAAPSRVDGVTTAWGYLLRAGGKKPRVALVFPDDSQVTISADESLTKALGARLYENVGIEGVATWRLPDWRMIAFKALRLLEYNPQQSNLVQTFKDLADASGGRWDNVDAAKYVEEIRGSDPQ